MDNEEMIRRDMERTRDSLTQKLETLENKVVGTVEQAASAVSETVSNVKETVDEGVESVKEAFDLGGHVDKHPWLMFGGAVCAGFVAGNLLLGKETGPSFSSPGAGFRPSPPPQPSRSASEGGGWRSILEPELKKLKELALGVTLGIAREALTAEVPRPIGKYVADIINEVTERMGGKTMPASDLPFASEESNNRSPMPGREGSDHRHNGAAA